MLAESGLAAAPKFGRFSVRTPPPPPAPTPLPRLFRAAREDGLAYIIREVDAKAGNSAYLVAKLDSPSSICGRLYTRPLGSVIRLL